MCPGEYYSYRQSEALPLVVLYGACVVEREPGPDRPPAVFPVCLSVCLSVTTPFLLCPSPAAERHCTVYYQKKSDATPAADNRGQGVRRGPLRVTTPLRSCLRHTTTGSCGHSSEAVCVVAGSQSCLVNWTTLVATTISRAERGSATCRSTCVVHV